ncbi:RNA-splicing factor [Coemansia spiralis]|uniref:RNA-splicing factor n=2 Tax=Coemansia TaxID=4863 RepID=A0A9W8GBU9_9FUNG|nr:RNA-splicing factor [Coemansia umbellata]KAJ2621968.1 RNA-splicing factor [Coemansia sp. RSA 1358]KAJ2680449.1 RNA-splicing factor [Coemansia spiralis]
MGSGDLNMKKSWHPQTLANQRRVAEEKRKAEEEAKRIAKMQKELREERQREEMDRLNASVTQKPINKLDWMYNAPSAGAPQSTDDFEAYLLGKRDASELLNDKGAADANKQIKKPEEKWKDGLFSFSNHNANSDRDTMAKAMEDPLMDIKRREQAAIQAMLNNPLQRKQLGLDGDGRQDKEKKRKKHSRHDRRDKDEQDEKRSHRHKHRHGHRHHSRNDRSQNSNSRAEIVPRKDDDYRRNRRSREDRERRSVSPKRSKPNSRRP